MDDINFSTTHIQGPDDEKPVRLYLARFENTESLVVNGNPISASGEMLVLANIDEEGNPVIEAIQRFALWTPPLEEFGGILSLAGLVNGLEFPPASQGEIKPFDVHMYFPVLGRLGPIYVESDAEFVRLEIMRGQLEWVAQSTDSDRSFFLQVKLVLDEIAGEAPPVDNFPKEVIFEFNLEFLLLENSRGRALEHHSLSACTGSAPSGSGTQHDCRSLEIRFVNLSNDSTETVMQIEHPFIDELVKGACEVWWEKGGIKINPEYSGPDAPAGYSIVNRPNATYSDLDFSEESSLPSVYPGPSTTSSYVAIYLVHRLLGDATNPRVGGAVAKNCGGNDPYVIIEIEKAKYNRYVLAHELGHVLGLRHPTGVDTVPDPDPVVQSFPNGSGSSVMTPNSPNSPRNTELNLLALNQSVIVPRLTTLGSSCNWDPNVLLEKNFYHVIRDFPYDDGTQPSSPYPQPPVDVWWTHSSVWNAHQGPSANDPHNKYADGTNMFKSDHSPIFELANEPTYSGPNWMYARVHASQALPTTQTVKVYLYIGVPGSATEPLKPLLNPSRPTPHNPTDPSVIFSGLAFPKPGEPKTLGLSWSAAGYPASCCVFAVASTSYDKSSEITDIISHPYNPADPTNPNVRHFYDLFGLLADHNDVAQRNLHIQGTASPSPSSGTNTSSASMLSWVQIDNPFEEPAVARLDIDATHALGLQGLMLEVNDEIVGDIKLGDRTSVTIADALQPGEHKVLRIRATLPPSVSLDATFPIQLNFIVNDKLVSGYTHVLRIVPLGDAMLQVLDLVFGSMQDTAVGCESDLAQFVANRTLQILSKERARRSPGCFGLLWRLIRPQNAWRSDLIKLSAEIAAVAGSLKDRTEPECQRISRRLDDFSELLIKSKNTDPAILIEQIRDLADRIQEPAGRLARQQLGA